MRYRYENPCSISVYSCKHPLYSACTLCKYEDIGLAVVRLRFNELTKMAFYTSIGNELAATISINDKLPEYIKAHGACKDENGLYPTVDIRKLMLALKIKPLPKNTWEKGFNECVKNTPSIMKRR